jgi:zinc transporter, ZIP family
VTPEATTIAPATHRRVTPMWVVALVPLVLLAGLIAFLIARGPGGTIRGDSYPPVERLALQSVRLSPGSIEVTAFNDGPDPVTIAQVVVDDAFWNFAASDGLTLRHLGRTRLRIPYPWVHGESHTLRIVTSTGVTFDHVVPVAVATPRPNASALGVFALIGLYVGVMPVAIGMLWYPLVRRLGAAGLDFVLALTVGLLLFLFVDAADEAIELARGLPGSFQGIALAVLAGGGAFFGLEALGAWMQRRKGHADSGWILALLVAVGIGLHNFGEGLAIGAAFALGEAALGSLLIVGFTLHNTTEGLAIVSPLARHRPGEAVPTWKLVQLGLIGGAPTIAGAWLGGFTYSPVWSVLFLACGVGAIAQVSVRILGQMADDGPIARLMVRGPVLAGLAAGFAIMYVTGMLIG